MGREDNKRIFEDTEIMCKTNLKLSTNIARSRRGQVIVLETDRPDCSKATVYEKYAKVVVSKKRTFEAASYYKDYKTAVLNFASATSPGGGVRHGSSAQEECLCRCSTLYFSLDTPEMWDGFYTPHWKMKDPIHNDDIIYTPDVTVFKTDTDNPVTMLESDWYNVDVITCAAPNLKPNPTNIFNPADGDAPVTISDVHLLDLHEMRLRRILDVAKVNHVEVIILGAFGCGAFKNKPEIVAIAAKHVLKDYLSYFKVIEYAIYSKRNNNFQVFERTLRPLTR